jgi:hypothetical protein
MRLRWDAADQPLSARPFLGSGRLALEYPTEAVSEAEPTDAGSKALIGLVGCVKTKLPHAAAARDLYTSPLFRGRLAAIDPRTDTWFVLSAEYGLVKPETVIEAYDLALSNMPVSARRNWSRKVVDQLRSQLGDLARFRFEIHAGHAYYGYGLEDALGNAHADVSVPTRGMSQGRQLQHYARGAAQHFTRQGSPGRSQEVKDCMSRTSAV